jgi:hypothetical protein
MMLQLHSRRWKFSVEGYTLAAALIIVLSCGLRLFFIAHDWPETNSDEGTVGIMTLHIAHLSDFPIYFYGQGTLGSLEAYVGALLFLMFGQTVFALRFGVLLLFIPFLVAMYQLASLLYNKKLALLTLVLLSIGSPELLFREFAAFAGHGETPLFGTLILLVATRLALSIPEVDSKPGKRRILGYGLWGFLVGAAFWNDPLSLPFALSSGLFLLLFCRTELRRSILLSATLGLLIGLIPCLIYSFTVPIAEGSLSVFSFLTAYAHPVASDSPFERFAAALLVSIPVSTGATILCPMSAKSAWPLDINNQQVMQCTALHGVWALVLVLLWLLAMIMTVEALCPFWQTLPATTKKPTQREVVEGARLMLLSSALLAFLIFAVSVQAITGPWSNHRYLMALGVATPALIWPLWRVWSMQLPRRLMVPSLKVLSVALLVFYSAALGVGAWQATWQFAETQNSTHEREILVTTLLHMHIRHIYTEYWTCDLTAFLSQEQITCSVVDNELQPGVNRYQPYVPEVARDKQAAYVFPDRFLTPTIWAKMQTLLGPDYRTITVDGYTITYRTEV